MVFDPFKFFFNVENECGRWWGWNVLCLAQAYCYTNEKLLFLEDILSKEGADSSFFLVGIYIGEF